MARPKPPTTGLSAKVSSVPRSRHRLSPIFLHRWVRTPRREGNGAMSRFSTLCRNRLIYCTSIKQRERKKFRQLNCPSARLKSCRRALCMLTYPFYLLSKPNSPQNGFRRERQSSLTKAIFILQKLCQSICFFYERFECAVNRFWDIEWTILCALYPPCVFSRQ